MSDPNASAPRARFSLGRLIDDFIVLASGQFLSKIFGFIAFAWLARALTTEQYGAVETAVGMAAIGIIALEMGTGAVGVRRIAQNGADPADVLGAVISGRLALAIIAAPTLALFYITMTNSSAPDLLFWLFAASLFAVPFNHNWFFQANERMGVAGFGQSLKMGVFLAAVMLLAPQKNGVIAVAYAEVIAASAMALWFCIFSYFLIRPARPVYSIANGGALIRESAQLGASSLVNALAQYLPILVVAAAASDTETAKFGAAQRLVLSMMTFSYVYYFNLFPLMARRMLDDPPALKRIVDASVRVTAWVGVIAAAMLTALAPAIMALVFGENYRPAGTEFAVLVWSGAIILASGNARWLLVAGKRQQSLLAAHLVNATLVVGLGFFLASRYGATGAATACVFGACGLWMVSHLRTRGFEVRPDLVGNILPVLTAAAIILLLTMIEPGPWLAAASSAAALIVGMALDRGLVGAAKTLMKAKAAT